MQLAIIARRNPLSIQQTISLVQRIVGLFLTLCLLSAASAQGGDQSRSSSRLVQAADWQRKDANQAKLALEGLILAAAEAGQNAILLAVNQTQAGAFANKAAPWMAGLSNNKPPFDPVETARAACTAAGIQLIAVYELFPRNGYPEFGLMSAGLQKNLLKLAVDYQLDGLVIDISRQLPKNIILDENDREDFYGRGNPNLLELSEWLKARDLRFGAALATRIKRLKPNLLTSLKSEPGQEVAPPSPSSKSQPWISGQVSDEQGVGLGNVQVSLKNSTGKVLASTLSDETGFYALSGWGTALRKTSLSFDFDGTESRELAVPWSPGIRGAASSALVDITLPGARRAEALPWLKVLRPRPATHHRTDKLNLLGRTIPGHRVWLVAPPPGDQENQPGSAQEIPVLSTGAFFLDRVALHGPRSQWLLRVRSPAGGLAEYPVFVKQEGGVSNPDEGTIAGTSSRFSVLSPQEDVLLLSGDILELRLSGPSKWKVQSASFGTITARSLVESPDPERPGVSNYSTRIRIPDNFSLSQRRIRFSCSNPKTKRAKELRSEGRVAVHNSLDPLIAETIAPLTGLHWGTHEVRLDGPYAAELNPGTRFQVIGQTGKRFKIRLSKNLSAWVDVADVKLLPAATKLPHGFFTTCEVSGIAGFDRIWLPISEAVPWAITPVLDEQGNWKLNLDIYNSHFAVTWFSHQESRRVVGFMSGQQIEDDWSRITIPLRGKQIWGYTMDNVKGGMWLTIKHPPQLKANPLEGLVIGLDAGHGGDKSGAVGYMGSQEKTINAWFCDDLTEALQAQKAKAILLRPDDFNTPFEQRLRSAVEAQASLILSIHANAGDMSGGFASLSGPSVYYKYDYSRTAAQFMYQELVKLTGKGDGLVGNFNFNLLRKTTTPDILVELAYLSNPAEEALLLDGDYRKSLAAAIVRGLDNYLKSLR